MIDEVIPDILKFDERYEDIIAAAAESGATNTVCEFLKEGGRVSGGNLCHLLASVRLVDPRMLLCLLLSGTFDFSDVTLWEKLRNEVPQNIVGLDFHRIGNVGVSIFQLSSMMSPLQSTATSSVQPDASPSAIPSFPYNNSSSFTFSLEQRIAIILNIIDIGSQYAKNIQRKHNQSEFNTQIMLLHEGKSGRKDGLKWENNKREELLGVIVQNCVQSNELSEEEGGGGERSYLAVCPDQYHSMGLLPLQVKTETTNSSNFNIKSPSFTCQVLGMHGGPLPYLLCRYWVSDKLIGGNLTSSKLSAKSLFPLLSGRAITGRLLSPPSLPPNHFLHSFIREVVCCCSPLTNRATVSALRELGHCCGNLQVGIDEDEASNLDCLRISAGRGFHDTLCKGQMEEEDEEVVKCYLECGTSCKAKCGGKRAWIGWMDEAACVDCDLTSHKYAQTYLNTHTNRLVRTRCYGQANTCPRGKGFHHGRSKHHSTNSSLPSQLIRTEINTQVLSSSISATILRKTLPASRLYESLVCLDPEIFSRLNGLMSRCTRVGEGEVGITALLETVNTESMTRFFPGLYHSVTRILGVCGVHDDNSFLSHLHNVLHAPLTTMLDVSMQLEAIDRDEQVDRREGGRSSEGRRRKSEVSMLFEAIEVACYSLENSEMQERASNAPTTASPPPVTTT